MRILVIGGTRFIGPRVVRRLAERGHELIVAHRGEHFANLPAGAREITDTSLGAPLVAIPESLRRLEPDVVIHMMAMGEADALAAVTAFAGVARRIVAPSSGDVYRAYGIFAGLEEGDPMPTPLREDAPLRERRFPYRAQGTPRDSIAYSYDKILAEQALCSDARLAATILRLPKVYGPEENADLGTIYGFRHASLWKWTHGFVENVAAAIALAAVDERAIGRTYNVGEAVTPTIAERLARLPEREELPTAAGAYRFEQHIEYDTSRIREELGYVEPVDEMRAMLELLTSQPVTADVRPSRGALERVLNRRASSTHRGRMASKKKSRRKYGKKAQKQVKRAMHEYKRGKLKAGKGRHGKARSRKQAIAIGLSEARKAGAKVPKKKKGSSRKKKSSRKRSHKRKS